MFHNTPLSIKNYNSLLISLSSQEVRKDLSITCELCNYSKEGAMARQKLIDNKNWEFNDGENKDTN
jgi:hypothetical protein